MNPINGSRRSFVIGSLLAAGGAPLLAQDAGKYPSRPLTIIIGAAPGGAADNVARTLGQRLTQALGQPHIVESKPGANQAIAMQAVAKAPPDGYTMFLGSTAYTLNLLRKDPPYRANDLKPLLHIGGSPAVMSVPVGLKVNTLEQFLQHARANPGKISYGTSGAGSGPHFAAEMLNVQAKLNMTHVPYRGEAAQLADLVSGEITAGFGSVGAMLPLVKAGRLRMIAVTGNTRLTAVPQVPTFDELGYQLPSGYFGIWLPAGTPAPIMKKLGDELVRIMHVPEVRQRIDELGVTPVGAGPDEFGKFLENEFRRWSAAAEATKIHVE